MTDQNLTPKAIKMLNEMAESRPDTTVAGLNLSPEAKRYLEFRFNTIGAVWSILPKLLGLVMAAIAILVTAPRITWNVNYMFTDKLGRFSLNYIFWNAPVFYEELAGEIIATAGGAFLIYLMFFRWEKKGAK